MKGTTPSNRRDFIKDTAAIAASIALLPAFPLAASAKITYEPAISI